MDIIDTSSGNVHTMDIHDPNGVNPVTISAMVVMNVISNSIVIVVISRYPQLREDRKTLFESSLRYNFISYKIIHELIQHIKLKSK